MIIHHLPTSDLAYSLVFDNNLSFLRRFRNKSKINRIATLINCLESIEFETDMPKLDSLWQSKVKRFSNKYKLIHKMISQYFKAIDASKIYTDIKKISSLDNDHYYVYLKHLSISGKVGTLGTRRLKRLLTNGYLPLKNVIKNKAFSNYYNSFLVDYILNLPNSIEYIVDIYDLDVDVFKDKEYYLGSMSNKTKDIEKNIDDYLNNNPDPFIVKCLLMHRNNSDYVIERKTKVKLYRFLKTNGFGKTYAIRPNIGFAGMFETKYEILENIGIQVKESYKKGIKSFLDICRYKTFINEYGYVDSIFSSNLHTSISASLSQTPKKQYGTYSYQKNVFLKKSATFINLYDTLNELEKSINILVNNSFNDVIGASYFFIDIKKSSQYRSINNEHLFNEVQSICRQFCVYQNHKTINNDLIICDDDSFKFADIESNIKVKYLELNKDSNIQTILHLLFSFGSPLSYCNNISEKSFVEHMMKYELDINMLSNYQKSAIDYLVDQGIVAINDNVIKYVDYGIIQLLYILYCWGSIPFYLLKDKYKQKAKALLNNNYLIKSNKLLSELEINYFSFVFDNSLYVGPALRNKYEHGKANFYSFSERKEDYILGIKSLIELLIKMYIDLYYSSHK